MSQSQAVIAYNNLLRSAASVTASSEAAGFAARNAWDGVTTTYWQPGGTGTQSLVAVFASAVSADYFAVFMHNLVSAGATIALRYSLDSGSTWSDAVAAFTPAQDNACALQLFDAVLADHWQVVVNASTSAPFLGVIAFGPRMTMCRGMPVGFIPPADSRSTEIYPNTTAGGAIAGRSVVPLGAQTSILNNSVPSSWVRDNWRAFMKAAEAFPFFFSWNVRDFPEECVYGTATVQSSGSAGSQQGLPGITQKEFGYADINLPVTVLMGAGGGA